MLHFRSSRVTEGIRLVNMYRFAKTALNVTGRAVRQVRHGSTAPQDFHSKYGTSVLVGGAAFCTVVWAYVLTQTGITWNLSPVGKVMPKPWRQADE
ncbi:Cytochrome c oxidase subunit 7B, mitochondrial Cytochrome c oxidase polypeptide VIIb Precursor [Channa argus]|uniref:Cytochrome c oxidase subunit 7B, mitochondrial n=1 Tax=Channa argus TaxID=215402 RepID=A0A6G1QWY8_CHAAH|nr:Cytochrome c oxidase subunit 7B, mitochondrial Cytochrome c oxidase polypeptide VIIb Precursor [Channa argus]